MTTSAHPRRRGASQRLDDHANTTYIVETLCLTDSDEPEEDADFSAPGPSNGGAGTKRKKPAPPARQPSQAPKAPKTSTAPRKTIPNQRPANHDLDQDDDVLPPLEYPQDHTRKIRNQLNKYKAESEARSTATPVDLPQQELVLLAGKAVRYMLFAHFEKPGVPVPRSKVSDAITADYKDHKAVRKLPQVVIPLAQELMLSNMGIDMREIERPSNNSKKEDAAGSKFYVCRSVLPPGVRAAILPGLQARRRAPPGFTLTVLALIHLSGGSIHEEALWEWLGKLGVSKDDEHPTLGKIPDQLHHMEACKYVARVKRGGAAGDQGSGVSFEWGECAHEEVGTQAIAAFIAKEFESHSHIPASQPQVQPQGGGGGRGAKQQGQVDVVELLDSDE